MLNWRSSRGTCIRFGAARRDAYDATVRHDATFISNTWLPLGFLKEQPLTFLNFCHGVDIIKLFIQCFRMVLHGVRCILPYAAICNKTGLG